MSNWSRDKDAWIATHCDGLKVSRTTAHCEYVYEQHNGRYEAVATYLTDPAAAIRAAQAWRKKDEDIDRTVVITLAIERMGIPCTAECSENYREGDGYKWRTFEGTASDKDVQPVSAALAQALYRATGGPA